MEAAEADAGRRIDALIAAKLPDLSRSRAQALITQGQVREGDRVIDEASLRVKPGARFLVTVPAPLDATPRGQDLALEVVYEDQDLLVVVKPAGMVVHPAPGHAEGTLVNALIAHCGDSLSGIGGVKRPGIVHRIDREVSGLLVVAKNDRAHLGLSAQLTVHAMERVYEAIVLGTPGHASGRIDAPLGRDPHDRLRMTILSSGKRAVTHWRLLEAAGIKAARLELQLETGRTHQIRVHLASIGHPIQGDRLYGGKAAAKRRQPEPPPAVARFLAGFGRIALHARSLGFVHPITGERLRFEQAPPASFGELLELWRI